MTKTNSVLLAAALVSSFGLSACQQNPFSDTNPDHLAVKIPEPHAVLPPYGFQVPDTLEFTEGTESSYDLKGYVPSPGVAIIDVLEAPAGVRFSQDEAKLVWTPAFETADPEVGYREFSMKLQLRSSIERSTALPKTITLRVLDRPRGFSITAGALEATEGQQLSATVKIASEDYLQGPFDVFTTGFPVGASFEKTSDPTVYRVRFRPDFLAVNNSDHYDYSKDAYYKNIDLNVSALDPAHRNVNTTLQVRIWDTFQKPLITAPSQVVQGGVVRFPVSAEDRNGEDLPEISLDGSAPFGRILLTDSGSDNRLTYPVKRVSVVWDQIPETHMGETVRLKFKACTRSDDDQPCESLSVNVTLADEVRQPPTIDRAQWSLGKQIYVKVGQMVSASIPVRSATPTGPFTVTIEPASARSEVTFTSGTVQLRPTAAGLKQFSLVARTPEGRMSVETFLYYALPGDWSSSFMLGLHPRDLDVPANLTLFPGLQVLNPLMQPLDERSLALRDRLVIGTSSLADASIAAALPQASAAVSQLFIHSPLIGALPAAMKSQLSTLGVTIKGRMADVLTDGSTLSVLPVTVALGASLSQPKKFVKLGGMLTTESTNPAVLEIANGSSCKPLLQLRHTAPDGDEYLTVAAVCSSGTSKKIVAGFEWADLKPTSGSTDDADIAATWLNQVLNPVLTTGALN